MSIQKDKSLKSNKSSPDLGFEELPGYRTLNITVDMEKTIDEMDLTAPNLDQTVKSSSFDEEEVTLKLVDSAIFHSDMERYQFINKVGEGAQGVVWRARDQDIGRVVAIKSFKGDLQLARESCQHEIHFAGKLDHPGIPPVHDVGKDHDGNCYFVMKYAEGESLGDLIGRLMRGDSHAHEKYPFHRRAEMIIQLLRILCSAHKQNIIHRDIKPSNILIGPTGELFLMDWGISIDLEHENGEDTLCGTPNYMSPEQVKMLPLDPRCDLFSTGAVFYEFLCLNRRLPQNHSLRETLELIRTQIPAQVDRQKHKAQGFPPSEYSKLIHKSLELLPENRFSSAEEMLGELERIQSGYINSVCNRTSIKGLIHSYMRWLDRDPFLSVPLTYIFILFFVSGFIALGWFFARL